MAIVKQNNLSFWERSKSQMRFRVRVKTPRQNILTRPASSPTSPKGRGLFLLALLLSTPIYAVDLLLPEQKIKAGLVYNSLKYTNWPTETASVIVCLYGGDPFGGSLQPMEGRSAGNRIIALREINDEQAIQSCNLLLVHANQHKFWPKLRALLSGHSILTVSDIPDFTQQGGMIEFTHANQRIQMKINLDAINTAGLHVQDTLLQLALVVRSERKP